MTYTPPKGTIIYHAAELAIQEAINYNQSVSLVFNELEVWVYPDSCVRDVYEKYYLQSKIRRLELMLED